MHTHRKKTSKRDAERKGKKEIGSIVSALHKPAFGRTNESQTHAVRSCKMKGNQCGNCGNNDLITVRRVDQLGSTDVVIYC